MPEDAPAEMMVNFMGLTGPQGVLPYVYSELILERVRAKDRSLAAFLDIFNHRAISLFYRAWQRTRFPVNYAAGVRDYFSQYLRDLLGTGHGGPARPPGHRRRSADALRLAGRHAIALGGGAGTDAGRLFRSAGRDQQFTGAWYSLDRSTQCAMNEKDTLVEPGWLRRGGGRRGVGSRQGACAFASAPSAWNATSTFCPAAAPYDALRAITRFFQQRLPRFRSAAGARSQRGAGRRT